MKTKEAIEIATKEIYRDELCDKASLIQYRAIELLGGINPETTKLVNYEMDQLTAAEILHWRLAAAKQQAAEAASHIDWLAAAMNEQRPSKPKHKPVKHSVERQRDIETRSIVHASSQQHHPRG